MLYTTITLADKEFKLRLTAASIEALEKKLNDNPLNVLIAMQNGELPMVSKLLFILHASMQKFHHGMTQLKVNDLFDEFVDAGGSSTDLIPELLEVFKISGFLPQTTEESEVEDPENQ